MTFFRSLFTRSYESNIPKFFLNHALYNFMLFMPIWVIFLQQKHHLTLTQVTFLDFAFWITMAITEVPTGAVADTIGRKHSIFIGALLSIVSVTLFALAPTYPLLLFANSLWPIAITFISGADVAFFYDSLRVLGRESEYSRMRGRVLIVEVASIGISSVLGGLLTLWEPTAPFLLYVGILGLMLLVTFSFKEPPRELDAKSGQHLSYRETLSQAFGAIRQHKTLQWALLYANLLPLAGAAVNITFIQPHAVAIGIPIAALGFVTLGINLARMAGSGSTHWLVEKLGERGWLGAAAGMVVVGVVGL
ncbi:MAG TPA: MFS transporter, partial [Anaerolineales bacterium]|nr:MFS transporter [Anaerolineales bacterium]